MNRQEIENHVALELLERYLQSYASSIWAIMLAPVTVSVVMWSQIDHRVLIGWAMLLTAGIAVRYFIAVAFMKRKVLHTEAARWGRWVAYPTGFLGVLWAAAVFLFYTGDSLPHLIFIIGITLSLVNSSVNAGVYGFPLYYIYSTPIIGALIIRLAMEGEFPYYALALLMILGNLMMFRVARNLHASVRNEMRLRRESAELSQALRLKSEEAQQAVLAKSRFLAAASHDLRQPLHSLALFIDLLKEARRDDERTELFTRIDFALGALSKLFDALLDISRLDANVVRPEFSHFDLTGLVGELVEEFAQTAENKRLALKVRCRCCVVVSDHVLLERILRNLIGNAMRYTDEGDVLVTCRSRGNSVLLQVWDTGSGIPADEHEAVFDEYYQLHNVHRDRAQGLGLGLSIVRRLCTLLNHPLELRSRPGRGSVFSILIQKGSASMVRGGHTELPVHSWDLTGRCLVVIDDERDILDAMEKLLSRWGAGVVAAESLSDAVDQLTDTQVIPDLVLSDLRLRDAESGIEAIDSLRAQFGESIPGILITGETSPEQIALVKHSGYEWLQKPVQPVRLRSVIQRRLAAGS